MFVEVQKLCAKTVHSIWESSLGTHYHSIEPQNIPIDPQGCAWFPLSGCGLDKTSAKSINAPEPSRDLQGTGSSKKKEEAQDVSGVNPFPPEGSGGLRRVQECLGKARRAKEDQEAG